MLVIVVAVFGLCWLPIHVFTMILDFKPEILHYETMEDAMTLMTIYLCVHWLAMSNSFANPLIYGFTNANFRVRSYNQEDTCMSSFVRTVIKREFL